MKLSFHNVSFKYPSTSEVAVTQLELTVVKGQRLGIIGHSGSGKSTLIQLMCGLLRPLEGAVRLGEKNVFDVPPAERRLGLVLQRPPAIRGVTVRELLERPARRTTSNDSVLSPIDALKRLRIDSHYHKPLNELSGGQQQRVHLARVLVWQPDFVILDEPFSSIDLQNKSLIYPLIRARQQMLGNALVLVTHDPQEALLLCDRILLLKEGKVLADGSADELVNNPPKVEAAQILGGYATNVMDVDLKAGRDCLVLSTPFGSLEGRIQYRRSSSEYPVELSGAFSWRDLVPEPVGPEVANMPIFHPVGGGAPINSVAPSLYENDKQPVYGCPANYNSDVVLRVKSSRVLLYDRGTGDLVGIFEVSGAGK